VQDLPYLIYLQTLTSMSIPGDRLSVTRGWLSHADYMTTIAIQWAQEGLE